MDIEQWKSFARKRIESGKMSEDEWEDILDVLADESDLYGLDEFDDAIQKAYEASK